MNVQYLNCKITINQSKDNKILPFDNYLIIFKDDNFSIHTNSKTLPIFITKLKNKKIIDNINYFSIVWKKESIRIDIKQIINKFNLIWLSNLNFQSIKEINLKEDLYIFIKKDNSKVIKEYNTPLGNVDLSFIKKWIIHLLELKNRKLKLEDVKQLERYYEYYNDLEIETACFLIWTWYSKKIIDYWKERNIFVLTYDEYKKFFPQKK